MNSASTSASPTRFKLGHKPVVGVIGGIGAGKSLVSQQLRELGCQVIDADKVGHLVLLDPSVNEELVRKFGSSILGETGEIDRKKLGEIVFRSPEAKKSLEQTVHPAMAVRFQEEISSALADPKVPMVVLDAAILLEAGWGDICDRIVYVDAPREDRLRRVMENRGWTPDELSRREDAQWPIERKKAQADDILLNDSSLEVVNQRVSRLIEGWRTDFSLGEVPGALVRP